MLESALIYLLAAVIAVPIAKRVGLGSVLGYLVAGLLIGPYALGFVGDQHEVMHFAEFGVVMMLFLIGLELQPSKLWQLRRSILGLGGSQVILTAAIIFAAMAVLLDFTWQANITIALALALSSTAIVIQSLAERGLLKTPTGENVFSVLLFQDIAVIPILALMPILAGGSEQGSGAHGHSVISHLASHWQALIIVAAIVGIILGGRFIANPIFRFVASSRSREIFTALSLLIVVAITVLMTALGLSPALGAFLAGVVLAESEFRHEMELDIEPFKSLLLGLFFITVGAGINLPIVAADPWFVVLGVVGLIAIKVLVLYVLAKMFKFAAYQTGVFTVALAQGGEFAFVLLAMGNSLHIVDATVNNLVIAVVAISMFVSPMLLVLFEKVAGSADQKASLEQDTIDEKGQVIIVGYGRFGQVVGRLLAAQGFKLTILDNRPSQIELLRRFGHKVFYGDSTRPDLLEAAGAAEAKLLIVCANQVDRSMEIIETAQRHFPDLPIIARAVDRPHAYMLSKMKLLAFRRETFDSAINLGVTALTHLGYDSNDADGAGQLFTEHDNAALESLADSWEDEKTYGIAIRQHFENLQDVLEIDKKREDTD